MTFRALLFALLCVPLACKKESPPEPIAPAAPTPKAAQAPAAPKKDPLTEVPRTDSTLSLLEPREGQCVWSRQDPVAQRRATVATVEGDCKGARIAWSQDLRKALLWFDPAWVQSAGYASQNASPAGYPDEKPQPGAKPRLYEVTIASGEVRALTFPTVEGQLRDIGYQGTELTALSLKDLPYDQAEPVTVDGQTLTFPEREGDALLSLASAYRLGKEGRFERTEVKGTTVGSETARGISILDAASKWGPQSAQLLDDSLDNTLEVTQEQSDKLLPLVPAPLVQEIQQNGMPDSDGWTRAQTPAGAVYVWQVMGDSVHNTGHLVFEREGQFSAVKELGFTDGEFVAVSTRGPFVLVSAKQVGTHPRLYDLRTGKPAFRSDTARATTFWPAP